MTTSEQCQELGAPIIRALKNWLITCSQPSMYAAPLYPRFPHIHGSSIYADRAALCYLLLTKILI